MTGYEIPEAMMTEITNALKSGVPVVTKNSTLSGVFIASNLDELNPTIRIVTLANNEIALLPIIWVS